MMQAKLKRLFFNHDTLYYGDCCSCPLILKSSRRTPYTQALAYLTYLLCQFF